MLGLSNKLNLLLICHCYKEANNIIRIISARKATKKEAKYYVKHLKQKLLLIQILA